MYTLASIPYFHWRNYSIGMLKTLITLYLV